MLRESVAPPVVQGALYNFAASIPGVTLMGDTTDHEGRAGVAVAMEYAGQRHELVFDPQTARLLEERDIVTDPNSDTGAAPGTVIGRATYLASGVVTSTDATP